MPLLPLAARVVGTENERDGGGEEEDGDRDGCEGDSPGDVLRESLVQSLVEGNHHDVSDTWSKRRAQRSTREPRGGQSAATYLLPCFKEKESMSASVFMTTEVRS